MRERLATASLNILSVAWLLAGGVLLFPALGWFALVIPPCATGTDCGSVAEIINDALLFGRTNVTQLRDVLYWSAILFLFLTLSALFIGIRLRAFLVQRRPYRFVRVVSAFGVIIASAFLLLLTHAGLTESWLDWVGTGCSDQNAISLCGAFPETRRLYLVAQYTSLLGGLRFWGTFTALFILILSLLLLSLPTKPNCAAIRSLVTSAPGIPPACTRCGVRGRINEDGTGESPTCILCQHDQLSDRHIPRPRWKFWARSTPVLLLVFVLGIRAAAAQSGEINWQPDSFCADSSIVCLELFPEGGVTDGISELRVNSLSETSAQPVLEISLVFSASIFRDNVDRVRVHLPSPLVRIPTLTEPESCELIIAALAPTPAADTAVIAQPYVEFTVEQAADAGSRSLFAFAYCSRVNLLSMGSNNPDFPSASTNEPLFIQGQPEHLSRIGAVLTNVRGRLATVFERLQQGACPGAPGQNPLTFNHLGAQMAVFIAQEIVEGTNWRGQVWERYRNVQPFTDNYAAIYCLLDQEPLSLWADLSQFPAEGDDLRVGFSVPLIDNSSGDILRRQLNIQRDGIDVYTEDRLPDEHAFVLDMPGLYTFSYTITGPESTYADSVVIENPPITMTRELNVVSLGGIPAPTPVGFMDRPVFSAASLDLPKLAEDTLTLNQAVGLTFGSLIIVGIGWGLLFYLPKRVRHAVSFSLIVVVLIAVVIWIVSRR